MSSAGTTYLGAYGQSRSTARPMVWTRRARSGANILVVADDQIVVGMLPNNRLKQASERLENGEGIYEVLGNRSTSIAMHAVQAVNARLNSTEIEFVYDKGGRRTAKQRFVMPDQEAQADALIAVRDRMKPAPQVVEETSSRLLYVMKPLNLMLLFAFLAAGAQTYFKTTMFDRDANRARLERFGARNGQQDFASADETGHDGSGHHVRTSRAPRWMSRNLAATKVVVLAVIVIGVIALVLNTIGYTVTMTVLLGATLLFLISVVSRLTNPPVTMSLIAGRRTGYVT